MVIVAASTTWRNLSLGPLLGVLAIALHDSCLDRAVEFAMMRPRPWRGVAPEVIDVCSRPWKHVVLLIVMAAFSVSDEPTQGYAQQHVVLIVVGLLLAAAGVGAFGDTVSASVDPPSKSLFDLENRTCALGKKNTIGIACATRDERKKNTWRNWMNAHLPTPGQR